MTDQEPSPQLFPANFGVLAQPTMKVKLTK